MFSSNSIGMLLFVHKKLDNSKRAFVSFRSASSLLSNLFFRVIPASTLSIAALSPCSIKVLIPFNRISAFCK